MAPSWLSGSKGSTSVDDLIARKKYAQAVELLRGEFKAGRRDPRVRLQLADVLVLAGRGREAVPILMGLADEFARDGFAAKAISVLKKVQKIEPRRPDVDRQLAALIKQKRDLPPLGGVRSPPYSTSSVGTGTDRRTSRRISSASTSRILASVVGTRRWPRTGSASAFTSSGRT